MPLADIAEKMYRQLEAIKDNRDDWFSVQTKLPRGLILSLGTNKKRGTFRLTLQRAHVLPSAQEIAICRASFKVPKEATQTEFVDHITATWKM